MTGRPRQPGGTEKARVIAIAVVIAAVLAVIGYGFPMLLTMLRWILS